MFFQNGYSCTSVFTFNLLGICLNTINSILFIISLAILIYQENYIAIVLYPICIALELYIFAFKPNFNLPIHQRICNWLSSGYLDIYLQCSTSNIPPFPYLTFCDSRELRCMLYSIGMYAKFLACYFSMDILDFPSFSLPLSCSIFAIGITLTYNMMCIALLWFSTHYNYSLKIGQQKGLKFLNHCWIFLCLRKNNDHYILIWFSFSCFMLDWFRNWLTIFLSDFAIQPLDDILHNYYIFIHVFLLLIFMLAAHLNPNGKNENTAWGFFIAMSLVSIFIEQLSFISLTPIFLVIGIHSKFDQINDNSLEWCLHMRRILHWTWVEFCKCELKEQQLYLMLCVNCVLFNDKMRKHIRISNVNHLRTPMNIHHTLSMYEERMRQTSAQISMEKLHCGVTDDLNLIIIEKMSELSTNYTWEISIFENLWSFGQLCSVMLGEKYFMTQISFTFAAISYCKYAHPLLIIFKLFGLFWQPFHPFLSFYYLSTVYIFNASDAGMEDVYIYIWIAMASVAISVYAWMLYYVVYVQFFCVVFPFEVVLWNIIPSNAYYDANGAKHTFPLSDRTLVKIKQSYGNYQQLPELMPILVDIFGKDIATAIMTFLPVYF